MKKIYYTDQDISGFVHNIIREMHRDGWRPDYIIGLTRGGLIPANMLSQYLEIPMQTLKVSLRDSQSELESNLWMAEDAFGYPEHDVIGGGDRRKNILVVDDINDTGATLNWIKQDWQSGCLPNDERWNEVWNQNVRFAVLVDNQASDFQDINYSGTEINKTEDPAWYIFPWENWWNK
jgi:hypoxanthine phosphoribosyltransferase